MGSIDAWVSGEGAIWVESATAGYEEQVLAVRVAYVHG